MTTLSSAVSALMTHWEAQSSPALRDLWPVALLAAVFPLVRLLLDSLVFEPAGRYLVFKSVRELSKITPASELAGSARLESIDREALERTHSKFKESCWKAVFWSSSTLFALHVCLGEPWMTNPQFFFLGPNDLVWPNLPMKVKVKAFLMYCGGFYLYSIFALFFWETRRKDFGVNLVHHLNATALSLLAYTFNFGRPAPLLVIFHDTCDIFLELAKLSRYANNESLATVFFATFTASWAYLRLWCFPRYIIYASSYEALQVLPLDQRPATGKSLYYVFNFILMLPLMLHIYWWILIVRVLVRQITDTKKIEDVRSDDESEKED